MDSEKRGGQRRMKMRLFIIILAVIMMFTLFGCGRPKYKLNLEGYGFNSPRTEYRAGETVTVYYDMIATDTNYRFWLDDGTEMTQDYDDEHGYVFTFIMPEHDVTMCCESYNSMMAYSEILVTFENEVAEADIWIIPQTGENLETSLWGTATVGKLGAGETAEVRLTQYDEAQAWLVHIIDENHAYYSAQDVRLADGFRIVFRTEDTAFESVIEVLDRDGSAVSRAEAFQGMLGAE